MKAIFDQYSKLLDLNQRLKLISDYWYLDPNGEIYLRSNSSYIERYGSLRDSSMLSLYLDNAVIPDELFEFSKVVPNKKYLNIIIDDGDTFLLSIPPKEDKHIKLSAMVKGNDDLPRVQDILFGELYKRMPSIIPKLDSLDYVGYPSNEIEKIVSGECVTHSSGAIDIVLSRGLLKSLKKDDILEIAVIPNELPNTGTAVIREVNKLCEIFSVFTILVLE